MIPSHLAPRRPSELLCRRYGNLDPRPDISVARRSFLCSTSRSSTSSGRNARQHINYGSSLFLAQMVEQHSTAGPAHLTSVWSVLLERMYVPLHRCPVGCPAFHASCLFEKIYTAFRFRDCAGSGHSWSLPLEHIATELTAPAHSTALRLLASTRLPIEHCRATPGTTTLAVVLSTLPLPSSGSRPRTTATLRGLP